MIMRCRGYLESSQGQAHGLPPVGFQTVAPRPGFTLLEMILATAIALLILGGLYMMLETQYVASQAGREVLEEGVLARSIMTRIAQDIANNLGAVDPRVLPDASSLTVEPTTAEPTTSTTDSTTTADSASDSTTMSESGGAMTTNAGVFNLQISGSSDRIMLSSSRLPADLLSTRATSVKSLSDLRRVSYWVIPELGLARYEIGTATSDEANYAPPNIPNAEKYLVAPEVKAIVFEYFDGSTWQANWEGTSVSEDGDTPIGPPSAIAINLTLEFRSTRPGSNPEPVRKTYRHVVALGAGNHFPRVQ